MDMTPTPAAQDARDAALADAVCLGQLAKRDAARPVCPEAANAVGRHLGFPLGLANMKRRLYSSPLGQHVKRVVSVCSDEQVSRVDAVSNVTRVHHNCAARDFSSMDSPRVSVRPVAVALSALERAIPVVRERSSPRPALKRASGGNFRPEPRSVSLGYVHTGVV